MPRRIEDISDAELAQMSGQTQQRDIRSISDEELASLAGGTERQPLTGPIQEAQQFGREQFAIKPATEQIKDAQAFGAEQFKGPEVPDFQTDIKDFISTQGRNFQPERDVEADIQDFIDTQGRNFDRQPSVQPGRRPKRREGGLLRKTIEDVISGGKQAAGSLAGLIAPAATGGVIPSALVSPDVGEDFERARKGIADIGRGGEATAESINRSIDELLGVLPSQFRGREVEGAYDFESAIEAGIEPDETGHFPSRIPSGPKEGLILKSETHPTFHKTVEAEKGLGNQFFRGPGGRLYSFAPGTELPKGQFRPAPEIFNQQRFESLGEVPVVGGALQAGSQLLRTATRAPVGVAGFLTGLPKFADPEPGQLEQEVEGLRQMGAAPFIAADYLTQKAFGVEDPSASVDPNSPLSRLIQGITGKPFNQEVYRQMVTSVVSESPETPLFGAGLGRGLVKGGVKAARGVAERVAPIRPGLRQPGVTPLNIPKPTLVAEKPPVVSPQPTVAIAEPTVAPAAVPAPKPVKLRPKAKAPEKAAIEAALPKQVDIAEAVTKDKTNPFTVRADAAEFPPGSEQFTVIKGAGREFSINFKKGEATPEAIVTKLNAKVEAAKPAKVKPKPTVVEKPPVKKPVAEVPVKPPGTVGLSKTENATLRKHFGLDRLPEVERESFVQSAATAKQGGLVGKAVEVANEVLKSRRPITTAEHAGMLLRASELVREYDASIKKQADLINKGDTKAAQQEFKTSEAIKANFDLLSEGTKLGRSEAAKTMSIGRAVTDITDNSSLRVQQRATAAKGSKLTSKEKTELNELSAKFAEAEKALETERAKHDKVLAEREKAIAEQVTKRLAAKQSRRKQSQEKIESIRKTGVSERAALKKQLEALGHRINDITGLSAEASWIVGRIAASYLKEGALTLDQVVKRVVKDLPDLTAQDVYRGLNTRNPRWKRAAKSEASQQLGALKQQARLLLEIEKAEQGVFAPKKKRAATKPEIRALRKQLTELRQAAWRSGMDAVKLEKALQTINELQDQLKNQFRSIKKKQPVENAELTATRDKIKDLRKQMRTEDAISDLKEQLRTGEFKRARKLEQRETTPELDRLAVERKRLDNKVRARIEALEPLNPARVFAEITNTNRASLATADISGWFRQNVIPVISHPIISGRQFPKSMKATFSEFNAEAIHNEIISRPHAYKYDKYGLEIRELDGILSKREESFSARLIEKVPIFGRVVRASNRNMTTVGNLLRTALFDDFLLKNPNALPIELKAYADALNVTTGIGRLGSFAQAANALSLGFFAPKLAISRIQTPLLFTRKTDGVRNFQLPRVRKQIARDLGGAVLTGGTFLGLVALMAKDNDNISVGADMREADWGKITVGNTHIDIWGGFQQPARLVARTALGITDRAGFTGKHLTKSDREFDYVEELMRFAQYKQAPFVGLTRSILEGRTAVGEEVTVTEALAKSVVPLILQDVREAYLDAGGLRATLAGGLAFVGVGVNTYKKSRSRTRRDIAKAILNNDFAEASRLQAEWNMNNPLKGQGISQDFVGKTTLRIAESKK